LLWPGKPVPDKAMRLSRLLGGGPMATSSAVTIPGDLYVLQYGIAGLLVGMFLIGLVVQWLTNPVKLCPSKRHLFIYACIFFPAANWEAGFFDYSVVVIRTFVIAQILASVVYGPPPRAPSRAGLLPGRAVPRR